MMKTISFRTDANSQIGAGHVVRCLSIAYACRQQGMRTIFLVSDGESEAYINKLTTQDPSLAPDEVVVLHSDDEKPHTEIAGMIETSSILLLDSYAFDNTYINRLKAASAGNTRIAIIDDFSRADLNADIIINYMPKGKEVHYKNADLVLAGLSYAPLRPQFAEGAKDESVGTGTLTHFSVRGAQPVRSAEKRVSVPVPHDSSPRILISTGGADRYHMRDAICECIPLTHSLTPVVADGSIADMATLMKSCDLAITAGGSTLIELCATGTPAIVFTVADNQLPQVRPLAEQGVISFAGSIGDGDETHVTAERAAVLKNIKTLLDDLLSDAEKRSAMSEKMRSLVDGRGAERIATALQNA